MTKIQWADKSWNPIAAYDRETGKRGWFCTKVSEGCTNCYAEKFNQFRGNGHLYRVGNLAKVRFELAPTLEDPLHWRKPRIVFVSSMTDLFLEAHTNEMIDQVFAVMALAPRHQFLVLTKRPDRMRDYVRSKLSDQRDRYTARLSQALSDVAVSQKMSWPLSQAWPVPNVWLGVSVEHQKAAYERIPILLSTPAAIRFLSCEPLLSPVDLTPFLYDEVEATTMPDYESPRPMSRGLAWVIVGGESGTDARPCEVEWIRDLAAQCRGTDVPVFVKQMGRWMGGDHTGFVVNRWLLDNGRVFVPPIIGARANIRPANAIAFGNCDTHGGTPAEWPEDLRVRQYPATVAA